MDVAGGTTHLALDARLIERNFGGSVCRRSVLWIQVADERLQCVIRTDVLHVVPKGGLTCWAFVVRLDGVQRNTDFTKRVKTFLHCVRVAKVPVTDGANEMAIENMALDFDEGSKEAASQRGVSIFIVIILRIRIQSEPEPDSDSEGT